MHSCSVWLPLTQNWMYSQAADVADLGVEMHVVCERTENLDQFGVGEIHTIDMPHRSRPFIDRALCRLGIRTHPGFIGAHGRRVSPHVVHSHFGMTGWVNLAAVRAIPARHVVTFYGYDVSLVPRQHSKWRRRFRKLFHEADLFLCEGSHMASELAALGCPDAKIRVHHLGVDVGRIDFHPRSWDGMDPLRILIAASFREKKGIPYALEAAARLAERIPVELTVIGDAGSSPSDQREKRIILEKVEQYRSRLKVRMLGYQPHDAMLMEAESHHVFLSPSITASDGDTEGGAPVSIIEMLATGMPVVSSMHADIPEVMGSPMAHLLAPERDVEALVGRLQWLVDNRGAWSQMLNAQRDRIEQEYARPVQAARLLDLYTSLL